MVYVSTNHHENKILEHMASIQKICYTNGIMSIKMTSNSKRSRQKKQEDETLGLQKNKNKM